MNLLLDTHVFLWLMAEPAKLPKAVMLALQDTGNGLYLSTASLWEMQIKSQRGKLTLDFSLAQLVREQADDGPFQLVPTEARHVLALNELPSRHQDPFDRMLIAQRRVEGFHLVTADQLIKQYAAQVQVLWAAG